MTGLVSLVVVGGLGGPPLAGAGPGPASAQESARAESPVQGRSRKAPLEADAPTRSSDHIAGSEGLEPAARRTVERRAFTKANRLHLRLGGTYLAREDFWISPGLTAEVGYQPLETFGIEVSSSVYFSTLDAAARALREDRGLLPDAQQPIVRVVAGPRWAFAYGKILIEDTDLVLHLDLALLLRLGLMVTDRSANLGGDLGLGLQIGLGDRWLVWAEVAGWLGYEDRERSFLSGGPMGTLGLGLQL